MDAAGKKEGWLMSLSRVSCGIHLKELPLVLGAFIFFPCEGAPIVQAKFEALRLAPADQSVSHHVCHRCDCRVAPSLRHIAALS